MDFTIISNRERRVPTKPIEAIMKRRIRVFGVLMFVTGLVVGLLCGLFGARYIFFHFRPDPQSISSKRADVIRKEYMLDAETHERILIENNRFFDEIEQEREARHNRMEELLDIHVENIARMLPDEASRKKWRGSFRSYFPSPPPPPMPPGNPQAGKKTGR